MCPMRPFFLVEIVWLSHANLCSIHPLFHVFILFSKARIAGQRISIYHFFALVSPIDDNTGMILLEFAAFFFRLQHPSPDTIRYIR